MGGSWSRRSKLNESDAKEIVRLHEQEGVAVAEIARKYGVTVSHVYKILYGQMFSAATGKPKYEPRRKNAPRMRLRGFPW